MSDKSKKRVVTARPAGEQTMGRKLYETIAATIRAMAETQQAQRA